MPVGTAMSKSAVSMVKTEETCGNGERDFPGAFCVHATLRTLAPPTPRHSHLRVADEVRRVGRASAVHPNPRRVPLAPLAPLVQLHHVRLVLAIARAPRVGATLRARARQALPELAHEDCERGGRNAKASARVGRSGEEPDEGSRASPAAARASGAPDRRARATTRARPHSCGHPSSHPPFLRPAVTGVTQWYLWLGKMMASPRSNV